MVSSGGYYVEPKMFGGNWYDFHNLYRSHSEAKEIAKELRNNGHHVRVFNTHHGWYVVYVRRSVGVMVSQKHYSGSKVPSKRRSASKGRTHKDILAFKRAAKRGSATKEKSEGYGWGSGGKAWGSRWKGALRRDESAKRTDKQRARSFKKVKK